MTIFLFKDDNMFAHYLNHWPINRSWHCWESFETKDTKRCILAHFERCFGSWKWWVKVESLGRSQAYARTHVRTVIFGWWKRWKLEKCNNIWRGYGVSNELIFCLKYSPNVTIWTYCLQKNRHAEGGFFKSLITSVRLMGAFIQRHIRCHEIRNWYTQLA